MPYIIKTHDAARGLITSRRAVATLDEARIEAWRLAHGPQWQNDAAHFKACAKIVEALPEQGGTVGPLPDGTVIEVDRVGWRGLWDVLGIVPGGWHTDLRRPTVTQQDRIIAAYNAAQEKATA